MKRRKRNGPTRQPKSQRRRIEYSRALLWMIAIMVMLAMGCREAERTQLVRRSQQAQAAYIDGDHKQALVWLRQNEEQGVLSNEDAVLLGRILLLQDDYSNAERYLRQVLRREPQHIDSRKWLARLALLHGQPQEAIDTLSPVLAISSEDPELLFLIGKSLLAQGNIEQAMETLVHARAIGVRLVEISLELSSIYRAAGADRQAREELIHARQLLPRESGLHSAIDAVLSNWKTSDGVSADDVAPSAEQTTGRANHE